MRVSVARLAQLLARKSTGQSSTQSESLLTFLSVCILHVLSVQMFLLMLQGGYGGGGGDMGGGGMGGGMGQSGNYSNPQAAQSSSSSMVRTVLQLCPVLS